MFNGDVIVKNLYFSDGTDVKTLLSQGAKKFDLSDMDYIDLGGIQLDGVKRNINFSGAGSITYSPDNAPNKQRYAASKSGPWHPTMQDGDIYCCDWNYTTGAWGEPYKKVGQDGRPGSDGSDATVNYNNIKAALQKAASIPSAFMSVDELGAPEIYGGKIYGAEIYANDFNVFPSDTTSMHGGFNLYGNYRGLQYLYAQMKIGSMDGTPQAVFTSGEGTGIPASWKFPNTYFAGHLDFGGCDDITWGKNAPKVYFE